MIAFLSFRFPPDIAAFGGSTRTSASTTVSTPTATRTRKEQVNFHKLFVRKIFFFVRKNIHFCHKTCPMNYNFINLIRYNALVDNRTQVIPSYKFLIWNKWNPDLVLVFIKSNLVQMSNRLQGLLPKSKSMF